MSAPLQRGWRDRQAKSVARRQDDERARIDAERQAHYAALQRDDAERAAVEAERRARARCSCPVCDTGTVTVEMAERVIRAMERLPADSPPDQFRLQILNALAMGERYHGNNALRPSPDLHYPRRAEVSPAEGPADVSPQPETVKPAPAKKIKTAVPPPPPWLDNDAVLEE